MRFIESEDEQDDSDREDGQTDNIVHVESFLWPAAKSIGAFP